MDGGLGAATHHDVRAAESDQVDAHGDRLVAGRTGRYRSVHAGLGADAQAHVAAGPLGINIGIDKGETRRGPFSLSTS